MHGTILRYGNAPDDPLVNVPRDANGPVRFALAEALDLDPSCGSGSFLRAGVSHFLTHNPDGTDNERLRLILRNVQGIDIHPVAVTISRATYVLALGKLVSSARKPIQIPVYLADSLFLPREVEASLIEKLSGVEITYGARKDRKTVVMPDMLIHMPEMFDDAIAA